VRERALRLRSACGGATPGANGARAVLAAVALAALPVAAAAAPASATAPPEPGLVLSLDGGYGWPLGDIAGGQALADLASGEVPVRFGIAYQFGGSLRAGAFLEIAPAFLRPGACSGGCNASSLRVGLEGQLHFLPRGAVDPWIGLGIGGEAFWAQALDEGAPAEITWAGFLIPIVQAGVDFEVSRTVRLGPWVGVLVGEFTQRSTSGPGQDGSIDARGWHGWLQTGLRATFAL
jgi:hypothetical protein